MQNAIRFLLAIGLMCFPGGVSAAAPARPVVAATIETTLTTSSGQIRQLAFDGDPGTYFASKENFGGGDHFTLVFDRPVAVKSIVVTTGLTRRRRPSRRGDFRGVR